MSNIAGKAYAMNLITPIRGPLVALNKLIFKAVGTPLLKFSLRGLQTLSMIHYARWVILRDKDFPRLSPTQPKEDLRYGYMMFCSNFNGSWEQYVDSFAAAIPSGLNLLWFMNVGWPKAIPELPFHRYVEFNQIWTDYYYSSYPMAASNDVKAAQRVKEELCTFVTKTENVGSEEFLRRYNVLLKDLQGDLSLLDSTPIVSLAAEDISARRRQAAGSPAPERLVAAAISEYLPEGSAANENQTREATDARANLRKTGSTREDRTDAE
ncbi:MAG: hypothetical protein RL701_5535 [Pseudomonadota bacterium]|jgi:hypothetical protein